MENKSLKSIYENHHRESRAPGFSILAAERGEGIKKILGTGKKILDIGCRDGALTSYFSEGNIVVGVDIDEVALAAAKDRLGIEIKVLDLNGPWEDLGGVKYDGVVMGEVLEHLYYPEKVLEKTKEVLKDGGVLVGTVPNAFSLKNRIRYLLGKKKNTPLSDPTHINHFSASELKKILSDKFSEVEIRGLGRYKVLASLLPSWFAFDLLFLAKK